MNKAELRQALLQGMKLTDLFHFTSGQECLVYKGAFRPGSQEIIYIPDLFVWDIDISEKLDPDQVDDVVRLSSTSIDFMEECHNDPHLAADLFAFVDWQLPNLGDLI